MSWSAVLIAMAIAADTFAGISNPVRAFTLLPLLFLAAIVWAAVTWRKESGTRLGGHLGR